MIKTYTVKHTINLDNIFFNTTKQTHYAYICVYISPRFIKNGNPDELHEIYEIKQLLYNIIRNHLTILPTNLCILSIEPGVTNKINLYDLIINISHKTLHKNYYQYDGIKYPYFPYLYI